MGFFYDIVSLLMDVPELFLFEKEINNII